MELENREFYFVAFFVSFILFLIASIILIVDISKDFHIIKAGEKISGVVQSTSNSGEEENTFIVKYIVDKEDYFIKNKLSISFFVNKHHLGDSTEVVYLEANPTVAVINTFEEIYLTKVLLSGMTLIFFISWIVVIKKKRWIMKQRGDMWPWG